MKSTELKNFAMKEIILNWEKIHELQILSQKLIDEIGRDPNLLILDTFVNSINIAVRIPHRLSLNHVLRNITEITKKLNTQYFENSTFQQFVAVEKEISDYLFKNYFRDESEDDSEIEFLGDSEDDLEIEFLDESHDDF